MTMCDSCPISTIADPGQELHYWDPHSCECRQFLPREPRFSPRPSPFAAYTKTALRTAILLRHAIGASRSGCHEAQGFLLTPGGSQVRGFLPLSDATGRFLVSRRVSSEALCCRTTESAFGLAQSLQVPPRQRTVDSDPKLFPPAGIFLYTSCCRFPVLSDIPFFLNTCITPHLALTSQVRPHLSATVHHPAFATASPLLHLGHTYNHHTTTMNR